MQYADIPYVKRPVSRIIFGTSMSPFLKGGDGSEILDAMLELGVSTIDTARVYKGAEESLGRWLEMRGVREQVVLLSKCGHPGVLGNKRVDAKNMQKDLETSLSRLRTDYIDMYVLHRDDPAVPVGEIVEIFNGFHDRGAIGAFGGSNWTHQRIEEANEYAYKHNLIPFTISSPNFGLADQVEDPWGGGCVSISGPTQAQAREWYRKVQMPVLAYSALGHGLFSGKIPDTALRPGNGGKEIARLLGPNGMKGYGSEENFERLRRCTRMAAEKGVTVAQMALAWMFGRGLNLFAVVSTSKKERMQENIAALDMRLTTEEMAYLDLRTK